MSDVRISVERTFSLDGLTVGHLRYLESALSDYTEHRKYDGIPSEVRTLLDEVRSVLDRIKQEDS